VTAPPSTAVLQTDGSLVESSEPLLTSPQYHGDRTKSAASPHVHPRWKSPRKPAPPETIAAPISSRIVCPPQSEPHQSRSSNLMQPPVTAPEPLLDTVAISDALPGQPTNGQQPHRHRHRHWTPVVRPVDTPPSGRRTRLWRPLTGSDRQIATAQFALLKERSPRRAVRVNSLSTQAVPHASISARLQRQQRTVLTATSTASNVEDTRRTSETLEREPRLASSLSIGQLRLPVGRTKSSKNATSRTVVHQPQPRRQDNPNLAAGTGPGSQQLQSPSLLPALTTGPDHHRPQGTVKLWL
jgi:hypothetical protein